MAARRLAGRLSLRDTLARNLATINMYAAAAGKPAQVLQASLVQKPKRAYAKRTASAQTEASVLTAIRDYLRLHRDVAFCWRMQSGVFVDGERMIRVGFKGLPDLIGMLRYTGRLFAIEVKRPGGKATPEQHEVLDWVRKQGGLAGVASSIEEAIVIVEGR